MFVCLFLETWYVAIILEGGDQDIEEPQGEHEQGGGKSELFRTTKFSTDCFMSSCYNHTDTDKGRNTEDCNREGQTAGLHLKYKISRFIQGHQ